MEKGPGRKFWLAILWGVALIAVLVLLLAFGVREAIVLGAWLAAFVSIPIQFGIANAAISKAYAEVDEARALSVVPPPKSK